MTQTKHDVTVIRTEHDLKAVLAKQYMKSIENFFGDPKQSLEFLSNVVTSVQRTPKLMECSSESLLNSFMTMASLKLMPSGVSGEAYVLPYNTKTGMVAQFQLGYQGLVTLFYRAGARSIVAEIVHIKDEFSNLNGEIKHVFNPFTDDRGEAIGAYVIVELQTGARIYKAMSKKEILDIGEKFSKSFKSFGPWSEDQDPQRWMWKKTVLKQAAKLVPKNETIYRAVAEDNKDSVISDQRSVSELPPAKTDYSAFEVLLRKAKSIEGLEYSWADIPGDAKVALKPVFDEMKAMITTEETSDIH